MPELPRGGSRIEQQGGGSRVEQQGGGSRVEQQGVEFIPEDERDSRPANVFAVFVGGNLAFSVIVFGWLPMTFGLSWWQAATSCLVGITLAAVLVAPLSLLGPRTGTNNVVASGAHFGVRGRLIGSALTLAFALAYAAIAVWTAGDALVSASHRLIGTPDGDGALAVGYALISLEIVLVSLYGHGAVVAAQRFVMPVAAVLLLLAVPALASHVHATPGGDYVLGGFWPTWALAVAVSVGGPLSYAPTLGDYTRRISRRRHADRAVLLATTGGVWLGLVLAAAFGIFTTMAFATPGDDYVADLVKVSPTWYVVPILLIALAGGLGQGVLNVYASGLDLEALIPRLSRLQTTLLTSGVAVALLYLGVFVVDATDAITSMTLVLNGLAGPWVAINAVGFVLTRRGTYDPADLQVFNEHRRGGRYWFTGGFDLRAVVPFVAGSAFGLLAVSTTLYTGPLANLADGIDLSLVGSAAIAAVGYVLAVRMFPEHPSDAAPVRGGVVA